MTSPRRRALLSVSDKTGVVEFARRLAVLGFELISTGGTARTLREAGLEVVDVATVTGFPEIMDGRVKTLHPAVHGGLLGRGDADRDVMQAHGIAPIEIAAVNLYPFEATVARPGTSRAEGIEQIDVGGPAMIRAAAKNHAHVAVVVDPADYPGIAAALEQGGGVAAPTRARLAAQAFAHTACYDAAIAAWLRQTDGADDAFPTRLALGLTRQAELRYGENPHQRAALYRVAGAGPGLLVDAVQHQGKPLSYNNIADADAALDCARAFRDTACVIVKHANPCGVGLGASAAEAYARAWATDPTSAFGGIIAFNVPVDADTAREILARQFLEVLVAPAFDAGALDVLATKPRVRVLATGPLAPARPGLSVHPVDGGLLVQDRDVATVGPDDLRVVTRRAPSVQERADALLAWQIVRFVKSNAIVCCRDGATVGIGAGQMSRVVSVEIAARKADDAGLSLAGAAMASDAFFPFRDGLEAAAAHGVSVVIHPGGSIRDEEVIAAADAHGMAMLFTGQRHFRH